MKRARSRSLGRVASLVIAIIAASSAGEASADQSVWGRARQPEAAARNAALKEAEDNINKHRLEMIDPPLGETVGGDLLRLGVMYLVEARRLLEDQAGGERSPDMRVRLRLGYVLRQLGQGNGPAKTKLIEEAARVLLPVTQSSAPAAIRAAAWSELALCHAMLGHREDEIRAETEALALEPIGTHRSQLLANRAEAYMGLGRLEEAIRGYREALSSLMPIDMFNYGVTVLWGLAVALDRDGDLGGALDAIQLARAYDRDDHELNSPGWFFSPPHDEHWYAALGHWSTARKTEQGAVKADAYMNALSAWDAYLAAAPAGDQWLPLARARRDACEKESSRALPGVRKQPKPEAPEHHGR